MLTLTDNTSFSKGSVMNDVRTPVESIPSDVRQRIATPQLKAVPPFNAMIAEQLRSVVAHTEQAAVGFAERLQTIDEVVTDPDAVLAMVERLFGGWSGPADEIIDHAEIDDTPCRSLR